MNFQSSPAAHGQPGLSTQSSIGILISNHTPAPAHSQSSSIIWSATLATFVNMLAQFFRPRSSSGLSSRHDSNPIVVFRGEERTRGLPNRIRMSRHASLTSRSKWPDGL